MRFSKVFLACSMVSISATAQVVDTSWLEENNKKQKLHLEQLQESGQLEIFKPDVVEKNTEKHFKEAQQIGQSSINKQTFSTEQYEGLEGDGSQTASNTDQMDPGIPISAEPSAQSQTLKAIFVSFSMSNKQLRDAFTEAGMLGAEIYFNGMHPDDENIGQTMRRLMTMGADIEPRPSARFHPKAFEEFNVSSVPYMISLSKGKVLTVAGMLNMTWLDEQGKDIAGRKDFGLQGSTTPVIERNLLEEIELRLSRVDFEDHKKKAIQRFWSKQKFVNLPAATKSESWLIDPTVKVTKDIVNPKGEVLARKGDVINPLASIPALNTYVLFNARDTRQLQWADRQRKSGKLVGTVMFMSSEFDSQKGWDHLASLRQHFQQEIYLIPKEMVVRFNVTGLPAIVSTDLNRKMLKVEQFLLE